MRWLHGVMLLAIVAFAGCASYGTATTCENNNDCPPGTTCNGGTCTADPPPDGGTPSCENDNECPAGWLCEDHLCQPPDGGPGGSDGGTGGSDGGTGGGPDGGTGGGSDGGTGGGPDGGTGGGSDGGTGGGSDGGTGGGPDGGTGGCSRDSDCPEHQVCEDGVCQPECGGGGDPGDGGPGDGGGGSCLNAVLDCKPGKVLICHIPPGNPANRHDICVGAPAVPAHTAHGDTLGCCPR